MSAPIIDNLSPPSHATAQPAESNFLSVILALAYLLLCGVGLVAKLTCQPSQWCSDNRTGTCSVFEIGQRMLEEIVCSAAQAFAAFL